MASADGFDLYTCEICLENMMDKNPRLLSCHHSFCTICLKKLVKRGAILCPTCRKSTPIPENDVNSLPANFVLQNIRIHMEKLYFSSGTLLCQFCLLEKPMLKCRDCAQLLCEECIRKHQKMKTFKDHKMFRLCQKHKEGIITFMCVACAQEACAKCVVTEHFEHEDQVKIYDNTKNRVESKPAEHYDVTDDIAQSLHKWKRQEELKIQSVNKTIKNLETIKLYHNKKLEEINKALTTKEYDFNEEMYSRHIKTSYNWHAAGNLESYTDLKNKVETLLDDVKVEMIISKNKNSDYYLENPILINTINCPGSNWSRPLNVWTAGSDVVLISDWDKSQVTCVYSSDKVPVLYSGRYGGVRDACIHENLLFTAYENCISKRNYNNGTVGPEIKYDPKMEDICSMLVNTESSVYLLSYSERRIIKCDLKKNRIHDVLTKLKNPVHLKMIQREDEILYLVTCLGYIDVYDTGWRILFSFGGCTGEMFHPCGTTYTERDILVADTLNHRICQYSFDGKFMGHILTRKDGITNPMGISFWKPFLWVTSDSPSSVKCFVIM